MLIIDVFKYLQKNPTFIDTKYQNNIKNIDFPTISGNENIQFIADNFASIFVDILQDLKRYDCYDDIVASWIESSKIIFFANAILFNNDFELKLKFLDLFKDNIAVKIIIINSPYFFSGISEVFVNASQKQSFAVVEFLYSLNLNLAVYSNNFNQDLIEFKTAINSYSLHDLVSLLNSLSFFQYKIEENHNLSKHLAEISTRLINIFKCETLDLSYDISPLMQIINSFKQYPYFVNNFKEEIREFIQEEILYYVDRDPSYVNIGASIDVLIHLAEKLGFISELHVLINKYLENIYYQQEQSTTNFTEELLKAIFFYSKLGIQDELFLVKFLHTAKANKSSFNDEQIDYINSFIQNIQFDSYFAKILNLKSYFDAYFDPSSSADLTLNFDILEENVASIEEINNNIVEMNISHRLSSFEVKNFLYSLLSSTNIGVFRLITSKLKQLFENEYFTDEKFVDKWMLQFLCLKKINKITKIDMQDFVEKWSFIKLNFFLFDKIYIKK